MRTRQPRAVGDSGLALVVAIVVTWVVFLLATVVLAGAIHNALSSRHSWKRLSTASAAESGVDDYLALMESSSSTLTAIRSGQWSNPPGAPTNLWRRTLLLGGQPASSVVQTAEYFTDAAFAIPFNLLTATDATFPTDLWVRLTSKAYSPSSCVPGSGHCVVRAMQASVRLSPQRNVLRGAFAGLFVCELGQSVAVRGSSADLYFLGSGGAGLAAACPAGNDLLVTTGSLKTDGSVYVLNGAATMTAGTLIKGNLYASGAITLSAAGGGGGGIGACRWNDPSKVLICGNAASGSTISGNTVLGSRSQNCSTCGVGAITFPVISSSSYPGYPPGIGGAYPPPPAGATNLGVAGTTTVYQPTNAASCTAATVLDLPRKVTLLGDVTIVSRCGFTIKNPTIISASSGTPLLSLVTFYSVPGGTPANCAALVGGVSADKRDSELKSNLQTENGARLFLYTPCSVIARNRLDISGALVAGTVFLRNNTTIESVGLGLSGSAAGLVAGFAQQVLWMREVR